MNLTLQISLLLFSRATPVPDLSDTIQEVAETGIQSAAVDGRSATGIPIPDLIEAAKFTAGATALTGANDNGGQRSGWNGLRPAQAIFRGPGNG